MHWKLARALGIFGSLCVASAVVLYKIVKAALEPEPYEKDIQDGRHDSGGVPKSQL